MTWFPLQSVRARLWAALALLSLAVIGICATTWMSLERVDKRLQELHRQTLSQVAQALELSKRSTDLATSAPYLLNQRSNFLINQEGRKLIQALDEVRVEWPTTEFGKESAENEVVAEAIDRLTEGVTDLIAASTSLEAIQAELRELVAHLGELREQASERIDDPNVDDSERLTWWALQSMTSDALNAAFAGNLIGVGEERRRYLNQRRSLSSLAPNTDQIAFLRRLDQIVSGESGVFERRRIELSTSLDAQNALFRIRHDAGVISTAASNFAINAEQFLAVERDSSSSAIQLTKLVVAAIALASLLLALISALYVSRYVTSNMARISSAMVQLAGGDRSSSLPRRFSSRDEIGDLFRSFRSFRANALRLDRSNRQLNQQNALFQKVFTNISDGIAITDATGKITAQNPALESILAHTPERNRPVTFLELLESGRFGTATAKAELKDDHRGYCELASDDGRFVELRASKLPDGGRVWLCSDITEQRELSDRLQQIDRIETLGKVAGDTAHDFGNILSTISTQTHLLETESDAKSRQALSAIVNAVEYGSSLTQRLLAFAKKQHLAPEIVDLNSLVHGMADLVEISLKPGVELTVNYSSNPVEVHVDPGQLESALLNLILNANQAISSSGTISVTLNVTENSTAQVTVEDTGTGMPADVLARVVEPFFTTKSGEGGTGLGLSIVYGFIKQTGGDLTIESVFGKGTRIELSLPLADASRSENTTYDECSVLLVEDQPKERSHAERIMREMGFQVDGVATGKEALAKMESREFDILMTDLDLGNGSTGWDLVDRYRADYPSNLAVVVSGRLPNEAEELERVRGNTLLIPKPLTKGNLRAALENSGSFVETKLGLGPRSASTATDRT